MGFPIKMWPYLVLLKLESDFKSRRSQDAEVVAVGVQIAQALLGLDEASRLLRPSWGLMRLRL